MTLQDVMRILLWLLIFFISFQIVLRMVRSIYKFPIPPFLTNLIDNPIRRRIQPPESTPARHGIRAGMHEFHRVLRHDGTLAFSEFLPDPDYSLPRTLNALAGDAGFRLKSHLGKLFYYTLRFEKCEEG